MGGTACCKTNIVIGLIRSDHLYIQIPNLISRGVLIATLITLCFILADYLHINMLKFVAGKVTVVNLFLLISYLDVNQHSNIVEHINWVLSELSVGVHKMLNRIGSACISLLQYNTSVYMHFISVGYSAI